MARSLRMPKSDPQTHLDARPLRSDAVANRERVLVAAAIAVRRDGEKVPMATIADKAGVGIGTLYRHYPTRPALLAALSRRSYGLVLDLAAAAAASDEPAPTAIARFFEQIITARDDLILPLHGGPVSLDEHTVRLRTEISDLLERVLARGRRDRTIRPDVTAVDIIITGAMLAQPLPHAPNWGLLARRQAGIYVAGLAATADTPLPGRPPNRAQLEAGFAGTSSRTGDSGPANE
jgi:AcrR family transcriptional regulator